MNLKTTLALLLFLASGIGLVQTGLQLPPTLDPVASERPRPPREGGARRVLQQLTPGELLRIEIGRGSENARVRNSSDRTILERRDPRSPWLMPGNWPTRSGEVRQLVELLCSLRSRFAPEVIQSSDDLAAFGLDKPAVIVTVKTTRDEHILAFADAPDSADTTQFDRPTYLRVDDGKEVLRLGPGLVSQLQRPADYYQQRRLFPSERVVKEEGSTGKVERLAGKRLEVIEQGKQKFALVRGKDGWELSEPYRDALDPRSRDQLLEALADLWAERFVSTSQKPEELGLDKPDRVLRVTRDDGSVVTLEIGKPNLDVTPPQQRSYARLRGFDRVFEINPDRLTNVYINLDTLRDNQLARFQSSDAREIEITTSKGTVVLRNTSPPGKPADGPVPTPSTWKLVRPVEASADSALVDRLLTNLSSLSAQEKDVTEKARTAAATGAVALPAAVGAHATLLSSWLLDPSRLAATYGLAPPAATIQVTVEESKGEARGKQRTITIRLGKHDARSKKMYATSQDWPRINEIDDSLAELVVGKGALDFRGKRVLDFVSADVERIEVRRPGLGLAGAGVIALITTPPGYGRLGAVGWLAASRPSALVLSRTSDGWNLTAPVKASADAIRVSDLADRLGRLEVVAWVASTASPEELQTKYGLQAPALRVQVSFRDAKKKVALLDVGKARADGQGYYARLDGAPEIFTIPGDLHEQLDRDALSYLPSTLWQVAGGDEITELRIHKAGQDEYALTRKGDDWQVTGPFTMSAPRAVVDKLTTALLSPKAEAYRALEVKDFAPYGLSKPAVKVTVKTRDKKEHVLWIGPDAGTQPGRLARLGKGESVFVVGDALAKVADQSALDFLDRTLLKFDPLAVVSVVRTHGKDVLELSKKDDAWHMVRPAEMAADERKVPELLRLLGELKAVRIAAFKPKDVKTFGLDNPETRVAIKLAGEKSAEHVLELGKPEGEEGARYARVRGGDVVAVLSADVVKKLLAEALAYRDHLLARVPDADVIRLEAGERKVTFAKPEGSWKLTQPLAAEADHDALENFFNGLARLRADELVVEKPTAEQVKAFGLDRPAFRWQFLSGDKVLLDLAVGASEPGGRRYARLAGEDLVFLLDAKLSGQVSAEYRPRAVFKDSIDPAQIEQVRFGYRKDGFALKKMDGDWQVVGKPDEKVNAMTVSDALSALRDLKLERYVVDDRAQLKLFGLDPPEMVLEFSTPTGKYTLHLGGLEGGSRRRYARVPAAGRSDVFLLDETASTKLFRTLAELTKASP